MKKRMASACLVAAVLTILLIGGSFSWFQAQTAAATGGRAGSIELALAYEQEQAGGAGGFTLENTGSLGAYVRLWYSFQYMQGGQPLMRDVSAISFSGFSLRREGQAQPFRFATLAHTAGGAAGEKAFLIPLDEAGGYYFMPPGAVLEAAYTLAGAEGDGLRVTWVAEAIQGSEQALEDAAAHGWEAGMARGAAEGGKPEGEA